MRAGLLEWGGRDELKQLKYVHPSSKACGSIPSDISDQTKGPTGVPLGTRRSFDIQ